MDTFILRLMDNYGYFGMFLGMILEAVIIIIPSELILATSGILASKKVFTLFNAFLVGLLGSIFCAIILYLMGYFGGEVFVHKYGKYFFMKDEDLEKSNFWFNKYGLLSALIGRNFPIVRTLISIPIGVMRLSFIKFLIYTTLGSIPWTFLFVYLGYCLGENWVFMQTIIDYFKLPIVLIIIMFIANIYRKKIKELRK